MNKIGKWMANELEMVNYGASLFILMWMIKYIKVIIDLPSIEGLLNDFNVDGYVDKVSKITNGDFSSMVVEMKKLRFKETI